ncbi:MAG TPA: FtsX-like permease family protein [Bryobacteraceae bacterium]|nr:FtsX-like permease family protein [Bryobacteraceae bacterium]
MLQPHFWRTGLRLAWRGLRNSRTRTALITSAMALSVASISGVRGAAEAARDALRGDSRAWLAADVAIDPRDSLLQEQADALDQMKPQGIAWTLLETTLTMASSSQSPDPGVIAVKAIDPAVYPFYGDLRLRPSLRLAQALRANTVAVSHDVLARFDVREGDTIQIAGQPFRISATIAAEPDRFTDELGLGMRCILSRQAYQRTGIERSENLVKHRVLIRLPRPSDLDFVRRRLREIFPEGNIRDFHGTHRQQTAVTEDAASFLTVTAFLALVLGAIGVAIAVRQHADARLPELAILRILGARSDQLAFVFFAEIACMAAAALVIGIPLSLLMRSSMLALASRYLALAPVSVWRPELILESSAATLGAMTPVLVHPALMIQRLKPALALRRDTREAAPRSRARSAFGWISAAIACASVATLAYRMLGSWTLAGFLTAALAGTIFIAWLLTAISLHLLHRAATAGWTWNAPMLRHGLAMLHRPGNHSRLLIVVLATVFALLAATFEVSAAVVRGIFNVLPFDRNGLYLAGFRETDRASVRAFLERLPGVERIQILTQARLELRMVKNPPIERFKAHAALPASAPPERRRSLQPLPVLADGSCPANYTLDTAGGRDACIPISIAARQAVAPDPSGADLRSELLLASQGVNALTASQWNDYYLRITKTTQRQPMFAPSNHLQTMTVDYYLEQRANSGLDNRSFLAVCDQDSHPVDGALPPAVVAEDVALPLGIRAGSILVLVDRDRTVLPTVTNVRKFTPVERFWAGLELDCSSLSPASLHVAGLHIKPNRFAAVEQAVRTEFPTLAVLSSEDIVGTIHAVSDDAMTLVRVTAWVAIGAGLCLLIAIVAASRATRLSEIGIFSALGARRNTLLRLYTIEFAALGLLSGFIACLLSCGFASAVLSIVFQRAQAILDWKAIAGGLLTAVLLTVGAAWLPAYGLLHRKPMEVLRRE